MPLASCHFSWQHGYTMNAAKKTAAKPAAPVIAKIAQEKLALETLETRNSDALDFKEMAVWQIKAALEAAYEAGRRAAK
jgi:hypothetical protein